MRLREFLDALQPIARTHPARGIASGMSIARDA
jgi:hypothetical protein